MPVSKETLDEIALSEAEYRLIVERLGREPTEVELGLFGALWSEHCGYKHSKPLLSMFPNTGRRVLVKAGEENAGAVDIGDGLSVVMKMESHNHPSAIEPFQGAATGVGGIVRDIFTMGARPIALLNSLRFGPLADARNRYLFNGVVGGIASLRQLPGHPGRGRRDLLLALVLREPAGERHVRGHGAERPDGQGRGQRGRQPADAGGGRHRPRRPSRGLRTGLADLRGPARSCARRCRWATPSWRSCSSRPAWSWPQTDWIVGVQDLGAAGLTSSAVESASKGGCGIEIDTALVPRREQGMNPYEVMLSESQERMLVVVKKGYQDKVKALFDRWGLHSDIIGRVTDDGMVRIRDGRKVVAARAGGHTDRSAPLPGPLPEAGLAREAPGLRPGRGPRSVSAPVPGDPAPAAGQPQHRQQALGVPAVRSPGADQHRGPSRAATGRCCASRTPGRPSR